MAYWWTRRLGRDANSFEALTRPHVDALWRTAVRITGDRAAAGDLTQEACLKAFKAFSRFRAGTNYRAWLFRILVNLCLDHLRRANRDPVQLGASLDQRGVAVLKDPPSNRPDAQLIRLEFRDTVAEALRKLSPEVRIVVSLALLDDRTYEEIAEIVGCPLGTVRSRLNRGRRQLQEDLKDFARDGTLAFHRAADQ